MRHRRPVQWQAPVDSPSLGVPHWVVDIGAVLEEKTDHGDDGRPGQPARVLQRRPLAGPGAHASELGRSLKVRAHRRRILSTDRLPPRPLRFHCLLEHLGGPVRIALPCNTHRRGRGTLRKLCCRSVVLVLGLGRRARGQKPLHSIGAALCSRMVQRSAAPLVREVVRRACVEQELHHLAVPAVARCV